MIGRIEECVDFRNCHSFGCLYHPRDFVTGAHISFLENAEVEPRPSARCEQGGHPGFVHSNADAITGNARLSDFEDRAADLIAVADANSIILQSLDREVLAELSMDEVRPP